MIEHPTFLVLGAGTSAEYGFPTGRGLIREIYDRLTNETKEWFPLLEDCGFEVPLIIDFGDRLWQADPPSVDDFLAIPNNNAKFKDIGKAIIALFLILHETKEAITRTNDESEETKLYTFLYYRMGTDAGSFKASASRLSIFTFNYDRSLEYYLHQTLTNQLGDEKQALDCLNYLHIYHVYGILCPPHYRDGSNGRPFTPAHDKQIIERCMKSMYMIGETNPDFAGIDRSYQLTAEVHNLCFLGFGYSPENILRLRFLKSFLDRVSIFGTAYHKSPNEVLEIQNLVHAPIDLGDPNQKSVEYLQSRLVL